MMQAPASRSLNFTWQPVPSDKRNGIILGYVIRVTSQRDDSTVQLYPAPSESTYIADIFKPYTVYTARIAAYTEVGTGPFSPEVSTMTPQDGKSVPHKYFE